MKSRTTGHATRAATEKIADAKLQIEGEGLADCVLAAVLMSDGGESFESSAEEERELLAAIEEADRAETMDGEALVRSLRG
jgi:hypothetical protein